MADMSLNELKEYVQMVLVQERLYNLQLQKIKELSFVKNTIKPPVQPVLEAVAVPTEDEEHNRVKGNRSFFFTVGAVVIGFLFAAITGFDSPIEGEIFWPLYLVFCGVVGWGLHRVLFSGADKQKEIDHYKNIDTGNAAINNRNELAKQKYMSDYMVYQAKLREIDQMNKVLNDRTREVKAVLDALYDENIIYYDYRNIVAVSYINQFLQAGRGTTLGEAYNHFAIETKLDQITGSLNSIEGKLDVIIKQLENINSSMVAGFKQISDQAAGFASQMFTHLSTISNNQASIAANQNVIINNQALQQDSLNVIADNTKVLNYIRNSRNRYVDISYFADEYNKNYR